LLSHAGLEATTTRKASGGEGESESEGEGEGDDPSRPAAGSAQG
jgi:hypothetical protein